MKKRILAGLLSAAMVVTLLPVSAVIAAPEDSNDSQSQVSVLADAENPGVNIATRATATTTQNKTKLIIANTLQRVNPAVETLPLWVLRHET